MIIPGADIVTNYEYDKHDNLKKVTDPNGNITTYEFDDFGRVQKQVSPVNGTSTYSYDAVGNLLTAIDGNGVTTTRVYDAANRVTSSISSKTGLTTETVAWAYDSQISGAYGKGRLASMTDPAGTTVYRYDRRGLLRLESRVSRGDTYTSRFTYDANGNRTIIRYPSNRVVDFTFDYADRPVSAISGSTTYVSGITYEPFGPEKNISYGNGTTRSMQYDTRYRPTTLALSGSSGNLFSYSYASDAAANLTAITDVLNAGFSRTFGYDDLNRLTTANSGGSLWASGSYQYDAMGNLLSNTLGSTSRIFSYSGATPKLMTVTENGSPRAVTYDAAGNEISIGTATYDYDVVNRLTRADGLLYRYDGRGLRHSVTEISSTGPVITAINPTSGPKAGGTVITISGLGFQSGATVRVGGVPATGVSVTPSQITATTPATSNDGVLLDVVVSNPGPVETTFVKGFFIPFSDTSGLGGVFEQFIEILLRNGVTAGCASGQYCPLNAVLRSQMAFFLLRSKEGSNYTPPPETGDIFQDVPPGSFGAAWIEELYNRGITGGCSVNPPLYCPNDPVTRAQMAVFLLKTLEGSTYVPPPAQGVFADVPPGDPLAPWIEELYRRGVTGGCTSDPLNYCPSSSVNRAQMAIFLTRTFNLGYPQATAGTRRDFYYTPELNLLADSEYTTSNYPLIFHEYIWMNGKPVAQVEPITSTTYWTGSDHLGTPLLLTRFDQTIYWRAEHEPYGRVWMLRSADEFQPLRLPGQEAEQLPLGANGRTDRSYNIFRWYRSSWGRYTQMDPVGIAFSSGEGIANPFAYVSGRPTHLIDPFGLFELDDSCNPCRGKPSGSDEFSKDRYAHLYRSVEHACRTRLDRVRNVSLRRCLRRSCDRGTVTCLWGCPEGRIGSGDVVEGSIAALFGGSVKNAKLCVNNWDELLANREGGVGGVALHEWAHGCGWWHKEKGTGSGVPCETGFNCSAP